MNELEKKVKVVWEALLERDHGVRRDGDRELLNGLWANLEDSDIEDVCSFAQGKWDSVEERWKKEELEGILARVGELVEDAVEKDLYKRYMSFDSAGYSEEKNGAEGQAIFYDEELITEGVAPDGTLKRTVRARAAALSEYLSKIAAVESSVVRFRKSVLGGPTNTLTPEKAGELIHFLAAQQQPGTLRDAETLLWLGNDHTANAEAITVWPGSTLWRLKTICASLAKKYRWSEDQACYLVLTGLPVSTRNSRREISRHSNKGVAAHKYNYATITLEMDAWMPSEYVRLVYRIAQRKLLGENNRQPELRNVKLFEFVVEHSQPELVDENEDLAKLAIPAWKRLRELWNKHYPEGHAWHYGKKREHRFSRDFYRAQLAVIGTPHGLPGVPGEPRTLAEYEEAYDQFVESLSAQVEQSRNKES